MRLNKPTLTSDLLYVSGTLNYGGTLVLTNLSGTPAEGDSFQLFTAGVYNGSFTAIVPATPGPGLTWNTNNLSSGMLSISGPPAITSFQISGSSLTVQGAFGPPNQQFALLASTNVTLPLNQWTPLDSNFFDGNGNFNLTTTINPTLPQQFYRLRTP